MTPEQRVAEATNAACSAHETGVTVGDVVECDPCGERFAHWARWLAHREATRAAAALDAVRAALASDDPAVMRAMAERVGLTVETREWVDRELTWDGGWTVIRRYERARVCGPWREVPNAD